MLGKVKPHQCKMSKHIVKGLFGTGPSTHAISELSASTKERIGKTSRMHVGLNRLLLLLNVCLYPLSQPSWGTNVSICVC